MCWEEGGCREGEGVSSLSRGLVCSGIRGGSAISTAEKGERKVRGLLWERGGARSCPVVVNCKVLFCGFWFCFTGGLREGRGGASTELASRRLHEHVTPSYVRGGEPAI